MLMRKYILFLALVLLFFGMLGQNVSTFFVWHRFRVLCGEEFFSRGYLDD